MDRQVANAPIDVPQEAEGNGICWQTVDELAALLRGRNLSPVELVEAMLRRIDALDGHLRSYLSVAADAAMAEARAAEAEIMAGCWRGPLHGIPFAVKDLLDTRGLATTCGSALLEDNVPDADAEAVRRLRGAGAILLGKLTMTEFAGIGYHPEVPPPSNPWSAGHWTGQSSSGSGVAAAAALCTVSLGSDTGGSLRYPASACGVVGVKPSRGRVSSRGAFPLAPTLDTIGPICRRVADAAHVLKVIAGYDAKDPASVRAPVPDYAAALTEGAAQVRIGFDDALCSRDVAKEVRAALDAALAVMEGLGARIVPVTLGDLDSAVGAWSAIFISECALSHARHYPARAAEYGPAMRGFLENAGGLRATDYATAVETQRRVLRMYEEVFDAVEVILTPTMAVTPPTVEEFPPSGLIPQEQAAALLRFTAPQALTGIPAISVPGGFSSAGLPIGIQFTGRAFGEAQLLRVARAFEAATEWHTRRPPFAGTAA